MSILAGFCHDLAENFELKKNSNAMWKQYVNVSEKGKKRFEDLVNEVVHPPLIQYVNKNTLDLKYLVSSHSIKFSPHITVADPGFGQGAQKMFPILLTAKQSWASVANQYQ